MAEFAGYSMPIRYSSIVAEHQACRSAAALFDVSHMGRLRFDGESAGNLLDHLLTRRVADLPVGRVRYALVCDEAGGVLDDVLVSHVETPSGQRYFLLVVNAANRRKILQWVTPLVGQFPGVTLTDRTELTAMIAVQGPRALAACGRLFASDPAALRFYRTRVTEFLGRPVIVSRTGYTGEDGFELVVRAEDATRVWENLMLAGREHGFVAAGLAARDTLRMEAAMPLYGHELDESIDPLAAGLAFACDLDNHDFIGGDALRAIRDRGPDRVRVGLLPEGRRPAREGCDVLSGRGEVIGRVTSGGPAPSLGVPIAMAYLPADYQDEEDLRIDIRGKCVPARRTGLPFYRRSATP